MVDLTVAEERRDFYVYVIFRPNGVPCYVGKGTGDRWEAHLRASHNSYLRRIAKKEDGRLPIIKAREGLTETEAFSTEVALIRAIGRCDIKTGPLVNLTAGGDGVCGHHRTLDQRAAMSAARKGRRVSREAAMKVSAALAGRPKTPQHCAAVSAAKKGKAGKPASAETRARMSAAQKCRWDQKAKEAHGLLMRQVNSCMSAEIRARKSARITAALTGKKLSPEHRAQISAVQRGRSKGSLSEAHRASLRLAAKGRDMSHTRTPTAKAKRRATYAAKRSGTITGQMELAL